MARPRIGVDFGAGRVERPVRQPVLPQAAIRVQQTWLDVSPLAAPAVDCEMLRQPPASLDQEIVKLPSPAAGVEYTMRVVTVAPCPAK